MLKKFWHSSKPSLFVWYESDHPTSNAHQTERNNGNLFKSCFELWETGRNPRKQDHSREIFSTDTLLAFCIIETIKWSGLRRNGGGEFQQGLKESIPNIPLPSFIYTSSVLFSWGRPFWVLLHHSFEKNPSTLQSNRLLLTSCTDIPNSYLSHLKPATLRTILRVPLHMLINEKKKRENFSVFSFKGITSSLKKNIGGPADNPGRIKISATQKP